MQKGETTHFEWQIQMEQLIFDNIRVQILSEDLIRIERARKGEFCDCNTFFIPNRTNYNQEVLYTSEDHVICIGDYELYIPEGGRSLSGVRLEKNGKKVYGYKKTANSGELPALDKTPEVFVVSDTPRILIPEGGYSKNRNGQYKVEEHVQDIYLLLCQKDPKKLRRLYVELTGRSELVRLSTLGSWNSKYYAYTEETAKQLILDYEAHDLPLDCMVIDTDWRSCEHGWGYDINKTLFPDMKRFLDFAHEHKVEIMFNDHPEPVEKNHVFRAKEIAYREKNLQRLLALGLDTWWYDRNWTTSLISPSKNLRWETLGMYLFHDITTHFYQKKSGNDSVYRRPDIMGNVVNIADGEYRGISDTASHRYSIQWTGDVASTMESMENEILTLIKAGNNAIVYVNSDCGGHFGNPNKEEFIRWMQYGTLSPVFRPHCTNYVERFREPWLYDEETLDIVREYSKLRYRLMPTLYKSAHEAYENGTPIFRGLGWNYPEDKRAHKYQRAYMLGENLLIRPVTETGKSDIYLPAGRWMNLFDGKIYEGKKLIRKQYGLREMPLFVRCGALIPLAYHARNTKEQGWDKLVLDFYPDKNASDSGYLYEDDTETTAYQFGQFRKSDYDAGYDVDENAFVIRLHAAQGTFEGEKCYEKRSLTVKFHQLKGIGDVQRVTVNGAEQSFERKNKTAGVFPMSTEMAAADARIVFMQFEAEADQEYEIKFYVK